MKCEDLTIAQLPNLHDFIIPDGMDDTSRLTIDLKLIKDGYIALGTLLANPDYGDDPAFREPLLAGMNAMATTFRELDEVGKEFMKFYFQMKR